MTETLIFIAVLGIFLLQMLGRYLTRMQVSEAEPEQGSVEVPQKQTPPARQPETPELASARPTELPQMAGQQQVASQRPPRQNPQAPAKVELRREASLRGGLVPRDRASLGRAMLLMELLGPPRGLDRPGTHHDY